MLGRIKNCFISTYKSFILVLLLLIVMDILAFRAMIPSDFENRALVIQQYYSIFYPTCIILLYAVIFYPFTEMDGHEIFYVGSRMKLIEAAIPFLMITVYMFVSTSVLFWSRIEFPARFCVVNFMVIVCFSALCYGFIYCFSGITVMIIATFILMLLGASTQVNFMNTLIFPTNKIHSFTEVMSFMIEYLIMGVAGIVAGVIGNKRYCRY